MSTLKSSAEDLTLNADGSGNDIKFQSNAVEVGELTDGGVLSSTGGSTHADNVKAKFGTGDDLEIYHDGSDSVIHDNGTGNLKIRANNLNILNAAATENYLWADNNGGVGIYYDNSKKFETSALGVTVTGGVSLGGTAAANTLDDYEEGTWTPVTRTLDESVTVHTATYTKIGNQVHARCAITFPSSLGSNANGGISGLPITSKNLGGYAGGGAGVIGNCSESALRSMVVNDNATNGEFRTSTGGSINSDTFEDGWLWISFVYAAQT